jgi:pimeloyl-ACP methyl ester carboxylesterase
MPESGRTIRLRDGRQLGFEEHGLAAGRAVFFFHGVPQSRVRGRIVAQYAGRYAGRLILVDRPGIGLSDFQPGRTIADWPADVVALAEALDIERFSILAISAGCAYALACGWKVPDRIHTIVVAGGMIELHAPGAMNDMLGDMRRFMTLARRAPWLLDPMLKAMAIGLRSFPHATMRQIFRNYSDVDRAVVGRPDFEAAQLADFNECFRQGTRGACYDATLASGPWGFRPEEVGTPVYFWHGEADRVHSPQGARRLSMAIQRSRITFVPDAGAMIGLERTDEIAQALLASAP